MNWFAYLKCAALPCIFIVEIIALTLFYHHRNKKRKRHQTYLVASLCISELNGVLAIIAVHIIYGRISALVDAILWFYIHCFVRLTYYFTMTTLAVDRFLVFYLNMRYLIVWPPEKPLKCLKFIYVISFFIWGCFVCSIVFELIEWKLVCLIMFIPYFIWDIIYIVQVIVTYFYIFGKYKENKEIMKKQTNKSNNREHFKLLIPTLLIASFICFFCIPDFVNMFFQFYHVEEKELLFNILGLSYRITWLADTAIYIYNCKLLPKNKVHSRSQTL